MVVKGFFRHNHRPVIKLIDYMRVPLTILKWPTKWPITISVIKINFKFGFQLDLPIYNCSSLNQTKKLPFFADKITILPNKNRYINLLYRNNKKNDASFITSLQHLTQLQFIGHHFTSHADIVRHYYCRFWQITLWLCTHTNIVYRM